MHCPDRFFVYACVALAILVTPGAVYSQPTTPAERETDAVRAASKEFQQCVRRADADALRKLCTTDGQYIDATGQVTKAGEMINRFAALPPSNDNAPEQAASEQTLRFLTPDVAMESKVDNTNAADGGLLNRRLTAIWVKREGKWLLDSLHEHVGEATPFNEHLKALDWLLGEWVGTTDDASILVSSHWSGGGNYIVREFVFARDRGEVVNATQRIGWDPVAKRIKSWTFDSQGGTGEEIWRHEGQRWIVDTSDVSPDGKQGKTSSVYIPVDENNYKWEVIGADVAGTKLKPLRVEFHRAADSD